ncbi:iron complex transport system substrate-binding protein [Salinimicrobium catena]|uniref:Iron complex transport system substrate-binding protein n=1 Tax=Salinimicrobium catena TaxID=390640 RepID=A0A1H5P350_9FLAO|nr:ABC transporter substrate-binding protein [Salinimicrobium catena]SDL67403.1 iron complex transport system substrate-binding protein [Salinimicrobium catena]SEF08343.1 iron complex transport system substrate-binding protein [Salinimicrobium catena]
MKPLFHILLLFLFGIFFGCKSEEGRKEMAKLPDGKEIPIKYASGLSITDYGNFRIITVKDPWPNADRSFKYLLAEENAEIPEGLKFDQKIKVPVQKIVVTSTTHIPSLEILNKEETLVGFPGLDYISSEATRKLIAEGKIKELGKNEALNTESLLSLQPDLIVAFSIDGSNKSLNTVEKSGIPVVFNSDWTENSPLGKAEWIKFFGALYGKIDSANSFFEQIEKEYNQAKELAKSAEESPSVVAGAMYKDQWYLPAGNSWQAIFLEDANSEYLFADSEGTGSLSLSFEAVLSQAASADFWIGPAQFQSYEEMRSASPHYTRFSAFQEKQVYTFSSEKGETGGVIFYELAPIRPDLVLKDLISILHPSLLPEYQTTFYKPLQ